MRSWQSWVMLFVSAVMLTTGAVAQIEIDATPIAPVELEVGTPPTVEVVQRHGQIGVTFTGLAPHHLFRAGQPITLTARLHNPGAAQQATVTTRVMAGFGALVKRQQETVMLSAGGSSELAIPIVTPDTPLPNGPYRVETLVTTTSNIGLGTTFVSIWNGPLATKSPMGGISLTGPLQATELAADLALLAQAGVQWVRFPLQGWLPQQGSPVPPEALQYQQLLDTITIQGMTPVAAFTPRTSVDPSVNGAQAEKEYMDSLLAAATQYGGTVKWWDLLRVKADPAYAEMKGIGFPILAKGVDALLKHDKNAQVLFTLEPPFKWNALELYHNKLPAKNGALGMQYTFVGQPEIQATPTPPTFDVGEVRSSGKTELKREPPMWVTEYGFSADRMKRFPNVDVHAAALLARATILNRTAEIERTFWRHDLRHAPLDAFTNVDGSAQPTVLALRTTLEQLDGVTSVVALQGGSKAQAMLLKYGETGKGKKRKAKRCALVIWNDAGPMTLTLKTKATRVDVMDIWGNSIELNPASGVALLYVDAFPRFIDVGSDDKVEVFGGFARFSPNRVLVRPGGGNAMHFEMFNDARLFGNTTVTCDLHFRQWPLNTEVRSQRISIDPQGRQTLEARLDIPQDAVRGQIYDVGVDIMLGTRRIGYLMLPVWYTPTPAAAPAADELGLP